MGEYRFATRMGNVSGSVIREILKLTQKPDIISFAGGLPSPDSFPVRELAEIAAGVISGNGRSVLQYGTSEGHPGLREFVAEWVARRGITATPADVLITSGSQQGIDLLAKAFLNPGDGVVVESPTYLAALQIFKTYEASFRVVPTDDQGVILTEARRVLTESRPKLFYLIPTFQNPTGKTLSRERREAVAQQAAETGTVVIEDDPYGELRYTGEELPALKSFDQEGRVVYLGSFSKIISPGLRVGFAVAPPEILHKMTIGKQATDVHTSNLSQAIVYEFCRRGLLPAHVEKIRKEYGEKREVMLAALAENLPAEATWTLPDGGLFLWVTLPEGCSTVELLKAAVEHQVAFIPGESFFAEGGGANTMRLNFSNASLEDIRVGMERLGAVIRRYLGSV